MHLLLEIAPHRSAIILTPDFKVYVQYGSPQKRDKKPLEGKVGPFIGQKIEAYMGLAEFYRRIGNFEKAQEYLDQVIEDDADLKFIHHSYVDYMGYLISKKDSDPHMISESEKTP